MNVQPGSPATALQQLGIGYSEKNGQLILTACPHCGAVDHAYMKNADTGPYMCHKCGGKGNLLTMRATAPQKAALSSVRNESALPAKKRGRIVATYDYTDESGALLYQVVRLDPKDFRQRRPDGKDGWCWSIKDVRQVPYNLPVILKADSVYICEGEKDVKTLCALGEVATCNSGGAEKWRPEFSQYFKGTHCIILPDNDPRGRAHAADVAAKLGGSTASIKIVTLPDLPEKGDVSDWIGSGGTAAALQRLCDETPETVPLEMVQPTTENPFAIPIKLKISKTQGWLLERPEPLDYIFEGLLVKGSVGLITAVGGVGKTSFIIPMAFSLITGGPLYDAFKPTRAFRVMLICAEDCEEIIRQRFFFLARTIPENMRAQIDIAINENLILICGQGLPVVEMKGNNPDFAEGLDYLKSLIKEHKPDVVILDPKASFYGGLDENNNSHNQKFIEALRSITDIDRTTVLFTHHESKAQAGTSTQFSSRGGQALSDGVRWQVTLARIDSKEATKLALNAQDVVKVTHVKSNYTRFFEPFYLRRDENGALDRVDAQALGDARLLAAIKEVLNDSELKVKPRDLDRAGGKDFRDRVIEITSFSGRVITKRTREFLKDGELQKDADGCLLAGLTTVADSKVSAC